MTPDGEKRRQKEKESGAVSVRLFKLQREAAEAKEALSRQRQEARAACQELQARAEREVMRAREEGRAALEQSNRAQTDVMRKVNAELGRRAALVRQLSAALKKAGQRPGALTGACAGAGATAKAGAGGEARGGAVTTAG